MSNTTSNHKKNKVFALGNAFVDYEYKISDELLELTGLPKGSATTVYSNEAQQTLIKQLEDNQATFVKRASGGSGANSIYAIAALGGSSSFSFCVSDDEAGRFYLQDLHDSGIESSVDSCRQSPKGTASCIVMVTDDAERTMQAYLGVSAEVDYSCVDEDLLQSSAFVYVEGYLAENAVAIEAVLQVQEFARAHDIKIAFSFSDPSVVNFSKPALLQMLGEGVDVLFSNQEEASIFTGETELVKASEQLHQYADLVVVTLGDQGAFVSQKTADGLDTFSVAASKVDNVIDTNGAGDSFAGAFMYGLTHDLGLEKSAKLAVAVAGKLVSVFGPRMPAAEYTKILHQL